VEIDKHMEYNMPAVQEKYCNIARAMGVNVDGLSVEEGAKAAVSAVK